MTDWKYKDILEMEHHTSSTHPRMPRAARAAQFSPFAALTGYEDVIEEAARLTDGRIELAEDARKALDEKFQTLERTGEAGQEVIITYFKEDARKKGGAYLTVSGRIKKTDGISGCIIMEDGISIPMADVFSLKEKE